jgi:hypothetical protein
LTEPLLNRLRVEYAIEKPSNKLLATTELDSDTWVGEVKRIRGEKQPLSSAGLHALRDEYTRTLEPARARAAVNGSDHRQGQTLDLILLKNPPVLKVSEDV